MSAVECHRYVWLFKFQVRQVVRAMGKKGGGGCVELTKDTERGEEKHSLHYYVEGETCLT